MILYDNQPGCITMGYDVNSTAGLVVPAVSIPDVYGKRLVEAAAGGGPLRASLEAVDVPLVDASAVLLFIMAVGTLVGGSVWSGLDHAASKRAAAEEQVGRSKGRV